MTTRARTAQAAARRRRRISSLPRLAGDGPRGATTVARNLSFCIGIGNEPVTPGGMAWTGRDTGGPFDPAYGVAPGLGAGNDDPVAHMRGWPVSITEPSLLDAPVGLRPVRVRDARAWRDSRVRNAAWLRPWEPTNPETPLYRSGLGPYIAMARTMRREARQGLALPWVVTYGGRFAGQLTVGSIIWGSARSAQVGYWIDEAAAGRGVIPTALAMAVDHCFMVVGLHRVEASIRPENQASRRVVEKLGFRDEGLRRRYLHIDGSWRDHLCYALTVEDVRGGLLARWRHTLSAQRSGTAS